ncbi:MAG: hypothetical protein EBE86_023705 [Hormoscilla sp. GUM202]|nr:hypothetical protein [Hormoscilla sp. GUM202]
METSLFGIWPNEEGQITIVARVLGTRINGNVIFLGLCWSDRVLSGLFGRAAELFVAGVCWRGGGFFAGVVRGDRV